MLTPSVIPVRLPSLTWASGSPLPLRLDGVQTHGPNGRRLLAVGLGIFTTSDVSTGAGVTAGAAACHSYIARLRLTDGLGERFNLRGMAVRAWARYEMQHRAPQDPAAGLVANTANQVIAPQFLLPFAPAEHRRPLDFAIPVADLVDNVELTCPTNGELVATGGSPTINSMSYQPYLYCAEENGDELHSRMEVKEYTLAAPDVFVPVGGGLLRALLRYDQGDSARGVTVPAETAYHCTTLQLSNVQPQALRAQYRMKSQGVWESNAPFDPNQTTGVGTVIVGARKLSECYQIAGNLALTLTGATGNVNAIACRVTGRTEASNPSDADALESGDLRVRTLKGFKDIEAFGKRYSRFYPLG